MIFYYVFVKYSHHSLHRFHLVVHIKDQRRDFLVAKYEIQSINFESGHDELLEQTIAPL